MRTFAILILIATTVEAQVTWSPTPFIQNRSSHAMAFDAARGRVVLFGGFGALPLADTWEWDGGKWTRLKPVTSPAARSGHAMAYDPVRRRVVLFGGFSGACNVEAPVLRDRLGTVAARRHPRRLRSQAKKPHGGVR